jgi:hypothetical protein
MSDGTPDTRGVAARVIAALRDQATSAVDATIPINPQDLLVLLDALDGRGTAYAPNAIGPMAPAPPAEVLEDEGNLRFGESISDRYHGHTPLHTPLRTPPGGVDDTEAGA